MMLTTVTGESVANIFDGNQILKLDLMAGKNIITGQRKFDQFLFASDLSKVFGLDHFLPNQYFSNYGYGISGKANLDYGAGNALIYYNIPFLRESTFDGSGNRTIQIGVTDLAPKFTSGQLFGGKTSNIRLPLYHPITGNRFDRYELSIHRSHENGVIKRLERTFINKSKSGFLD